MPKTIALQIEEAAAIKRGRTETDQQYLSRIAKTLADVDEKTFNALPPEAKDWYDKACDALDAKKDIPLLPGTEKPAEPAAPSRRRPAAAEAAASETAPAEETAPSRSTRRRQTPAEPAPATTTAAAEPAPEPRRRAAPKAAVKKAVTKKAAPKAAVKKAAVKKPRGQSQQAFIREIVIGDPNLDESKVIAKVQGKFPDATSGTISTGRANTRAVLAQLQAKGFLNRNYAAEHFSS